MISFRLSIEITRPESSLLTTSNPRISAWVILLRVVLPLCIGGMVKEDICRDLQMKYIAPTIPFLLPDFDL
jgi:hypothetical protein